MGNGLSVSSVVDQLHALQPEARSEALVKLCDQHDDEIRDYLKSIYHWDLEPPEQQQLGKPRAKQPPRLRTIHIKNSVPEEQRLTENERSVWSRDPSAFWTSPTYTFLPSEACHEPLRFVYDATTRIEPRSHQDCLRRRYLALFWFDYFNTIYPEQETAFDHEYVDLGRHVLGSAVKDSDATVSTLREQVKAGRKYNMLSRRFGDGILLSLPSSIGRSTLERRLPLDQETFDAWIAPVVGSTWEEQAGTEGIRDLGQRIRQSLLERCLTRHSNGSARPLKKCRTNITHAAVQETASSVTLIALGSLASPITPSILPQGHRIHSKSFHAKKQPTYAQNVANVQDMLPGNDLSAPPAQNDTWPYRAERQRASRDETSAACGVSPETFIPPLFYAMGDHIPKVVLDRATSPQPRWSEHGEFCVVTPHGAGLHRDLVDLLSDNAKLKQSIEELISLSIISEVSRDGFQTYSCRDDPTKILYDQDRTYWIHRAFELCCYIFPQSQILDSSFGTIGKQLLPVLQHLLRLYEEATLEIPPRKDAVEALVAASKFGAMRNRKYLLSLATELQKDPEQADLRAMIVHRESILLRFSKKISDSQLTIQQFLDRPFTVASPRLHCLLGLLRLSQAENWAYQFNHQKVYEEAQKWEPGDKPSAMQLYVLRTKLSVLAQSYKGDGLFEDAKSALEGCLAAMKPHDSERYLVKANLADLYCELDHLKRNEPVILNTMYLEKAEKIVVPEIEHLRTRNWSSKPSRRLLLSLIEIEILQGRHRVAEVLIKELLDMYERLAEHDTNDQVGHVRALIAWARISAPSEAVARWHNAYHCNKRYNPSEADVFTCGVIYLFISLAYFKLGDEHESWANFSHASEIISKKKPQFLMPGIGTYLYSFARRELASAAGWQLPGVLL